MAKCLVTGATGFIGAHLVRALVANGDEVTCLIRDPSKLIALSGVEVQVARGDVTRPDTLSGALAGCDVVFHLAGLTKALDPRAMFAVNRDGVANLMRACAKRISPPTVVLVSSLAAAGPAVDDMPHEPDDVPHPISHYGCSKLAGELAAAQFADSVPLTIVRPPIVIGEGDLLSLDLFHSVSTFRLHVVPGRRGNRFSVVHVSDLVDAMLRAAARGERVAPVSSSVAMASASVSVGGTAVLQIPEQELEIAPRGQGIYYPADAEMPTFAEFGHLIAQSVGRKRILVMHTPQAVAWGLAGMAELAARAIRTPLSLNFDKVREGLAGSWTCSPRTAEEDLGFRPKASLAERFRQTGQWYLEQGWL